MEIRKFNNLNDVPSKIMVPNPGKRTYTPQETFKPIKSSDLPRKILGKLMGFSVLTDDSVHPAYALQGQPLNINGITNVNILDNIAKVLLLQDGIYTARYTKSSDPFKISPDEFILTTNKKIAYFVVVLESEVINTNHLSRYRLIEP